jgi:hypothetical protein
MDPAFVGSKTTTLIQRVVEAYRARSGAVDVVMMSPWGIKHDDLLAKMARTGTDGSLRLALLFDGKRKSDAADIRRRLLENAQVEEGELREALDRFRIEVAPSLPRLGSMLDDKLGRHRFVTVGEEALSNVYDDLGRKLIGQEVREFDRESLRELLRGEGLTAEGEGQPEPARVGIRSFVRQAEYLDEFTTLLDLVPSFARRRLRAGESWRDIAAQVRQFMCGVDDVRHDVVEMHLSCHVSLAYAAGHAVSPKSSTRYHARQPGQRGDDLWDLGERAPGPQADFWTTRVAHLREDAADVAVAVAVAQPAGDDVRTYVKRHLPSVGTLIVLEPTSGVGRTSVRDGAHAAALAETYAQIVNAERTTDQRRHMLHVLAASPTSLAFLMGRAGSRLGPTTLYEFDLEANDPEAYASAIVLDNTP